MERTARPLSKLSLSNFRRASPSPAAGLPLSPVTVIQDGSYLEVLSLKLNEAVSKALAQPNGPAALHEQLAGRRPIPAGRGRALGAVVASEVKASRENPQVYRALIRTLQRPMSVLVTNVSSNLLPLLSSPAFQMTLTPMPQSTVPNATQLHAIGWATFAGEVLETFDELGLGLDTDMRGDGLKAVRDGLASVVKRVIEPLMNGIKNEIMPVIEGLENARPVASTIHGAGVKGTSGTKSPVPHPSIASLQHLMPHYARALARCAGSTMAETMLAPLLISLVWRGVVALSHRPAPAPSPPNSPAMVAVGSKLKETRSRTSSSPPTTPPSSRFTLKLPPSRPVSPSGTLGSKGTTAAADARALYDLLNMLPRPSAAKEMTRLAREAVDEAFDALSALAALLEYVQVHIMLHRGRSSASCTEACTLADLGTDLDVLTADLPLLIALPPVLQGFVYLSAQDAPTGERSIASILGLTEEGYRKGCLSGFGRADECAVAVGQRVADVLRAGTKVYGDASLERVRIVVDWVDRQVAEAAADH